MTTNGARLCAFPDCGAACCQHCRSRLVSCRRGIALRGLRAYTPRADPYSSPTTREWLGPVVSGLRAHAPYARHPASCRAGSLPSVARSEQQGRAPQPVRLARLVAPTCCSLGARTCRDPCGETSGRPRASGEMDSPSPARDDAKRAASSHLLDDDDPPLGPHAILLRDLHLELDQVRTRRQRREIYLHRPC
jgi:hypothetical protein